ncbi:MAG: SDR family oxidoreductase [Polyangiaceae bacterium]|nr:SDR family oxidoreductase [Polyangiaceae bacterium]
MTDRDDFPVPPLDGWALILGASSGFGEAAALALARAGVDIIGVHLDRRGTMPHVERLVVSLREMGREAWFYNVNAADEDKRAEVLDDVNRRFTERGRGEKVRVLLHSLAFGTLKPLVGEDAVNQKQVDMTCDVMAHSLVYWTQDLLSRQLLSNQGRIFAMTSTGAAQVWRGYGVVSSAKAALESHIRQLALELGPAGITANAICAGVTDTPALKKIPDSDAMREVAIRKNPSHRLTRPEDVGRALVALAQPCTYWLTGNVLYVDGGEAHSG